MDGGRWLEVWADGTGLSVVLYAPEDVEGWPKYGEPLRGDR